MMTLLSPDFRRRLKTIPHAVRAVRLLRYLTDPHQRSIQRLQTGPRSGLLQPSPETTSNRYPLFFRFIADQLADNPEPNILSYGCSTGQEAFSLQDYLPHARIKGIDINPNNIRICRKRMVRSSGANPVFECAASPAQEPDARYDAIFCMAVTRHGRLEAERPDRCDALLPFTAFDTLMTDLERCLRPGGFLVIANSHFDLGDARIAPRFEMVLCKPFAKHYARLNYGPDNRRNDASSYVDAAYRKLREYSDTPEGSHAAATQG